jgi:hypothetical protein
MSMPVIIGHRVLDLHAGVHLDEVELAVLVEELEGPGAAVADLAARFGATLADALAGRGVDARCRCLLDHLLVATLHRAVGEHLELDVARVAEELLHVDDVAAERRRRLAAGQRDGVEQGGMGVHHAHAATTAARRGLDQHRVADLLGEIAVDLVVVAERATGARYARHACLAHGTDRGDLVAHQTDGVGARADEGEAAAFDLLGEIGVLGQEAVAGVDGVGVGHLGRADDRRDVEVARGGGGRADADRLVGEQHVLEVAVGGRVDRNGADAELMAGAQDAQRDFAAVGNDELVEHGGGAAQLMTNSGSPYSTGSPFSTRIALTTPARSASIWFIIFIASMMHSVSPALTSCPTSTNDFVSGPEAR